MDKKSTGKKSITMQAEQFHTMMQTMRTRIHNNDDLQHFGSFFFVMEAKGIKHRTSCNVQSSGENPYEALCAKFTSVDVGALMRRENGQVLMDIGLSYHPKLYKASASNSSHNPNCKDPVPLIALWDLIHLKGSCNTAGYNRGMFHHTNTMENYGGHQSEMRINWAALVHICFRSSYWLYYEPVRRVQRGEITFCNDSDAYHMNEAFLKSLDGYHTNLLGATNKTYGARDEIQCSGAAICSEMKDLPELVGPHSIKWWLL